MDLRIALAGNPNSGKTTLFNALTGSVQFVGNWPGVTVEKKEGKLKKHSGIVITDLPGIYSLSPYTPEEVTARNYLTEERPDTILNIIDGTNLERNLYLTTQLTELGIPVVAAVNMMDLVKKNGDAIDTNALSKALGCSVVEISALKGDGVMEAAECAIDAARHAKTTPHHIFSDAAEHAIAQIEEIAVHHMPKEQQHWYAVKIFERDDKVLERINPGQKTLLRIEEAIQAAEREMDDDAESIITNERYLYISQIISGCCQKKSAGGLSASDKIDKIVTNRWLGLPIFAAVMFFVYYIAMVTAGTAATDWANDGLFGDGWHLFGIGASSYSEAVDYAAKNGWEEPDPADYGIWIPGIPPLVEHGLESVKTSDWLSGLILDGIVAGVGAVLGFVPQMLVLFLLLAILESCGYMARIAFVLDRLFRKFGLSGKSFIPMIVGTGCGVPGIMASRTIENDRSRRITIMTTTFIPCGAKIPFISMIAGAIFGGSAWVASSAYFVGMAAIIISGIILKKTRLFAGDPAPFVMELPAYRLPAAKNVLLSAWERSSSFIKKAGTIILLSTILIWFTTYFGFVDGSFRMLAEEEIDSSILAAAGGLTAWIFKPLGWGNWQAVTASITGLVAKENIVGTMGILYGGRSDTVYQSLAGAFGKTAGYSFLVFNLLCAPCFAAIGAIKREMNSAKWTWYAVIFQCLSAYAVSLIINQFGLLFTGHADAIGLFSAAAVLIFILYMLFRPQSRNDSFRHIE